MPTGWKQSTKTRTWSTAKSIAVTLIGMLADQGKMTLDEPLPLEWLPEERSPGTDPRAEITLRHVLNMSSGLYTVDNRGMEYATGSGLAYWAGASSVKGTQSGTDLAARAPFGIMKTTIPSRGCWL